MLKCLHRRDVQEIGLTGTGGRMTYQWASRGAMVSVSSSLAGTCHRRQTAGSDFTLGLTFPGIVCGIFCSSSSKRVHPDAPVSSRCSLWHFILLAFTGFLRVLRFLLGF